jgi:type I restriction enzyme S subunit
MSAWPETELGDVLADATSGFACGEDVDDGVFQFRMNNITTEGQLDLSKRRRVPRDYRNIDRFLVQPGDVLFNATNSPDLVGKTAFFPGLEEPAVFSNHFLRLRPRDGEIDGRYLTRWLNLQFKHGRFKGMCRQWVNQATVGRDALLSLRFPLPPLPEQRRIAEILDKVDALRAKRRAALAQLDTLTQSIFLDMFGDPATNPKGWPIGRFEDQITSVRYGTGSPPPYVDEGLPFIRATNIKAGTITAKGLKRISPDEAARIEKCRVQAGNLIIVRSGVNTGDCAIVPSEYDGAYAAFDLIVELSWVNAVFYNFLINSPHGKSHLEPLTRRAAQPHLNAEQVRSLRFIAPEESTKQRFAKVVGLIDKLKGRGDVGLRALDALFASLQHRAFRGEL